MTKIYIVCVGVSMQCWSFVINYKIIQCTLEKRTSVDCLFFKRRDTCFTQSGDGMPTHQLKQRPCEILYLTTGDNHHGVYLYSTSNCNKYDQININLK